MGTVPFPLTGDTIDELRTQIYEILRQVYEDKIGGADLGDVFGLSGETLTLVLDPAGSGLKKDGNKLAIDCNASGGLTTTANGLFVKNDGMSLAAGTDGLRVNCNPTGGIASADYGIYVKKNGDTLISDTDGLKVNAWDTGWSTVNISETKSLDGATAGLPEVVHVLGSLLNVLIAKGVLTA